MREAGSIDVRLHSVGYGAEGVLLFEVRPLEPAPLLPARAGAHVDLHLPGGRTRQYSLVTPFCSPRRYVFAVKREPEGRGGSRWLHDEARVGSVLGIGLPRDVFTLNEDAPRSVLLAGGIGITPIYSMFKRLTDLGREVQLHYWARSERHVLFHEDLGAAADVHVWLGESAAGRPTVSGIVAAADHQAELYCCGPRRMIEEFERAAADRPARLKHVERFAGGPLERSGAFEVDCARSGVTVSVGPAQSILEAVLAAGIDVPYSCEEGVCGACECPVLAGDPEHLDTFYRGDPADRPRSMMICCSRSASPKLVLDA